MAGMGDASFKMEEGLSVFAMLGILGNTAMRVSILSISGAD